MPAGTRLDLAEELVPWAAFRIVPPVNEEPIRINTHNTPKNINRPWDPREG